MNDFPIEKEGHYLLIFGYEVKGIKQELIHYCNYALEIPQFGIKHSLDVSVNIVIVLWEIVRAFQK
ncbi:MAG: TrmH family RNA methyltransferase [Flavobacteriales bacterium]